MEIECFECGEKYEVSIDDEDLPRCPDCGFGPEQCSHPIEFRESEQIYSVDEGQYVERLHCGKCGTPSSEM